MKRKTRLRLLKKRDARLYTSMNALIKDKAFLNEEDFNEIERQIMFKYMIQTNYIFGIKIFPARIITEYVEG